MTLTAARLREVLRYDPASGIFTRLPRPIGSDTAWNDKMWNARYAGREAGCIKHGYTLGYRIISIDDSQYRAHRLAFLFMTGASPTAALHYHGEYARVDTSYREAMGLERTDRESVLRRLSSRLVECSIEEVTMAQHGVVDMPSPSPPARVTPKLVGNVSEWPPAHNGGSVKIVDRAVVNAPGPYAAESPRQERSR